MMIEASIKERKSGRNSGTGLDARLIDILGGENRYYVIHGT